MNKLTLIGFLKCALLELSDTETLSISKLAKEQQDNKILLAPLALYAVLTDKTRLCKSNILLYEECLRLKESADYKACGDAYKEIYQDYESICNKSLVEDEFKEKIRKRILDIQREKKISNYRIYTDLELNHGNVNSFLKNGDYRKLSMDAVRRIWKYVERI